MEPEIFPAGDISPCPESPLWKVLDSKGCFLLVPKYNYTQKNFCSSLISEFLCLKHPAYIGQGKILQSVSNVFASFLLSWLSVAEYDSNSTVARQFQ